MRLPSRRVAPIRSSTNSRHFPTKEAVVLDDPYDLMIAVGVAAQDPQSSALERVRLGLSAVMEHVGEDDESIRVRVRLAAAHPGLRARIWQNNHRTEKAIVHALVCSGGDPFEASVAAGAVLGSMMLGKATPGQVGVSRPISSMRPSSSEDCKSSRASRTPVRTEYRITLYAIPSPTIKTRMPPTISIKSPPLRNLARRPDSGPSTDHSDDAALSYLSG